MDAATILSEIRRAADRLEAGDVIALEAGGCTLVIELRSRAHCLAAAAIAPAADHPLLADTSPGRLAALGAALTSRSGGRVVVEELGASTSALVSEHVGGDASGTALGVRVLQGSPARAPVTLAIALADLVDPRGAGLPLPPGRVVPAERQTDLRRACSARRVARPTG